MKTPSRKNLCPVSKNFYATIYERVRESLSLIGRDDAVSQTMICIDRYLADGIIPSADADLCILLTFNLLRSEIDKAIQRSLRARQARRTARQFSRIS